MSEEDPAPSETPTPAPSIAWRGRIRWLFIGPRGLRGGWGALLFLAVFGALAAGFLFAVRPIARGLPTEPGMGLSEPALVAAAFLATWILSLVERRPFTSFGLGGPQRLRNFAVGVLLGLVALASLMTALVLAGAMRLGPPDLDGGSLLVWGAFWACVFLLVGFAEEMVARGYLLCALSRGMGFWPAALLISLLFGVAHAGNQGEAVTGLVAAGLIGLLNAYSFKWSGSLWWAIGLHASWNWGETFFYGVSNSGRTVDHHFLVAAPRGAAWLSGGSVGPEGSVLVFLVIALLVLGVRVPLRGVATPDLDRARPPEAPAPAEPLAS